MRYDSGTFKSVYLSFPLETLPSVYASDMMQCLLDWISEPGPDQSNEYMGDSVWIDVGVSIGDPWAQSFVPSQGSISKVEFYMFSTLSSSDYFEIQIRPDAGGIPSGGYLTNGYISSGSIPVGAPAWVPCDFGSGITLTVGQTYWIVCYRFGNIGQQNWLADFNMSYLPGSAIHDVGGNVWSGAQPYDWLFRTYPQPSGGTEKSIVLNPTKDTTIYEEDPSRGNGAGDYLLAGTNWAVFNIRSLLEFNIAGNIPEYSTITDVDLALRCCHAYNSDSYLLDLHPVTTEWGEAGSDAPDAWEEYGATPTADDDATWNYAYYNDESWLGPGGGDFGPSSEHQVVGSQDMTYYWSSIGMIEDVQRWLDDPGTNHGWELIGDESMSGTVKWFNSKDYGVDPDYWPRLMVLYNEPVVVGYRDVFWIAGDTYGPTPPATCYKVIPSENLKLKPMTDGTLPQFFSLAVDDLGNPLCAGSGQSYMYYYDGNGWILIPDNQGFLNSYSFEAMDFNPNDRRFYAADVSYLFYTDPVPFESGSSKCYKFNNFFGNGDDINSIAWNNLHDYGLMAEGPAVYKIWPYGETGNGSLRWSTVFEGVGTEWFYDISWDTDGWNEAGIVGRYSTGRGYYRYYHSNPQVLSGYQELAGSYYTCAFKPPSSPKWVFIPYGGGSVRINVEEKDQSSELVVNSEFPHIFSMSMWKQSDPLKLSTFNSQVEANSTYTFAFVGNYTRAGVDYWDDLDIYLTAWFDFGNTGTFSQPGDPTWTSANYRNSQFNLTYDPVANTASVLYPAPFPPAGPEFVIHSSWEDPTTYGSDGLSHRLLLNVTFGAQNTMAWGAGTPPGAGGIWMQNSALNDPWTWDARFMLVDSAMTSAKNMSWQEFGIRRYASLSISGSPSGSIPPGALAGLPDPTVIHYSTNVQYKLNVSIPHLYKDGIPGPVYIAAPYVQVWNDHSNADGTNSNISAYTNFAGANRNQFVWGTVGSWIQPVGSGIESAGPMYSDYTAAAVPEPFEVTEVWWAVEVPVGTPEGIYRATITITLWS
jgi:hypothetical protein